MEPKKTLHHVLVADDSATIHKAVRLTLPVEEFRVTMAHDGKGALEVIKSQQVDLILADVNMPEMNGYDLSYAVKVRHDMPDIPVILMCGTFDKFDQDRFIWSKANHRIWKPFETRLFLEVVREYVSESGKTRGNARAAEVKRVVSSIDHSVESEIVSPLDRFREDDEVVAGHDQKPSSPVDSQEPPSEKRPGSAPKVETTNVGFKVDAGVRAWLQTAEGQRLIQQTIQQHLDRVLTKLEKEIVDRVQEESWEAPVEEAINVYHP